MQDQSRVGIDISSILVISEVVRDLFRSQSHTSDGNNSITDTQIPVAVDAISYTQVKLAEESHIGLGRTNVVILSVVRPSVGGRVACQTINLLTLADGVPVDAKLAATLNGPPGEQAILNQTTNLETDQVVVDIHIIEDVVDVR